MKVLHVLDHSAPLHSGYAFRTLALLQEQRALGYEVVCVTSTKQGTSKAPVEEVNDIAFYRSVQSQALYARLPVLNQIAVIRDTQRRLREVIAAIRPDLLHAHSPCLMGFAALGASEGLPVVYEMRASWEDAAVDHGTTTPGSVRYRLSRRLETSVLARAHAITTICEGLRRDIIDRGIDPDRVTVIPNGVDVDRFPWLDSPDPEIRRLLGLDAGLVLGFAGSFYGYEGLDVMIRAMPGIVQMEPHARLLLVGGGPEEAALRGLARELGIEHAVIMPGRVPHGDIARYYSVIDMLVFPRKSIRLTEIVTPLKPLEAMAQGKLVLASDVGGHRELIHEGKTGYLFEPDNPQAIVKALGKALERRAEWTTLRRDARAFVESQRTWRHAASAYPAVYASAIDRAQE